MAYTLKTQTFTGPIEKLLELIEEREFDITTISLAAVTTDFLSYLDSLREVPPIILADFIVVASRLMLLKSRALLPDLVLNEEEQADIKDLEERLKLYQEFKLAGKNINKLYQNNKISYGRELLGSYTPAIFYPSPKLTVKNLKNSLETLVRALEAVEWREKKLARSAIITIEEKMRELVSHLGAKPVSEFKELAKNKDEMIALFLAVLHLLKESLIEIDQRENFSEITIKKKQGNG